jgi:hypothetical protein
VRALVAGLAIAAIVIAVTISNRRGVAGAAEIVEAVKV